MNGWQPCVYRRPGRNRSGKRPAFCEQVTGYTLAIGKEFCEQCGIRQVVRPRPRQEWQSIPPSAPEQDWLEELGIG